MISPFSPFFCLSLPWHPLFASSNLTWHGLTLRTTTWNVNAPACVEATLRLLDTQVLHCHCGDVRGTELMQQETLGRPRPRSVGFRPVGHTHDSCIATALLAEVWRSQKVRSMRLRTTTLNVNAPAYVEATLRLLETQVLHCHCGDVRGTELMQQETLERPRPRSVGFRPVRHTHNSCIATALLAEVGRSQRVRSMRVWGACT